MKKRATPYENARRRNPADDEPWKQEFLPQLIKPAEPAPKPVKSASIPTAEALLARLKVKASSLDELIGHFQLSKLPEQNALEKRLLELARSGAVQMDRRGRLAPAGLVEKPAPLPAAAPLPLVPPVPATAARSKEPAAKPAAAAPEPAAAPMPEAPKARATIAVGSEVNGRVSAHRDGFGFLVIEPKSPDDVFLPAREMRGLMTGDRARVRITSVDATGRLSGEFVAMVSTAPRFVVGRLRLDGSRWMVTPDNQKAQPFELYISQNDLGGAKAGQVVRAEITTPAGSKGGLAGRISEIVGEHLAPGLEIEIALRRHDLPWEWPEAVTAEAEAFDPLVHEDDAEGRVDLRKTPLMTIDGADARDFDDAVYAEKLRGGSFKLLVAIADVSAYVQVGSLLDDEAKNRGTSVYFPRRVIPMLPEALSNGLCSLNPKVDRLCMVCEMRVSKEGEVTSAKFYEAVMNSHARLIYDDVAAMLADPKGELAKAHAPLLPHLQALDALFEVLFAARTRRGAIDFEGSETKFEFTEDSKIARIVPVVRNRAHRLIEECMILANVEAAKFVAPKQTPTLYRVHERPEATRIAVLKDFLATRAMSLSGGELPEARDFAAVSDAAKGRPDTSLIQMMILRTMAQARYSPEVLGHFGLALTHYAHFTSPIRRYPDLLLHRAIKHVLSRRKITSFAYNDEQMDQLGAHCSTTERRADEATREVASWLKCEFMSHRVGETFEGVVNAVTSFGLFVELNGLFIEGLVHISALGDDYYSFDPKTQRLTGKRSGRAFALGQPLTVQLVRVNLEERKIDLVPAAVQGKAKTAEPKPDSEDVHRLAKQLRAAATQEEPRARKGKWPAKTAKSKAGQGAPKPGKPSKRNKRR